MSLPRRRESLPRYAGRNIHDAKSPRATREEIFVARSVAAACGKKYSLREMSPRYAGTNRVREMI